MIQVFFFLPLWELQFTFKTVGGASTHKHCWVSTYYHACLVLTVVQVYLLYFLQVFVFINHGAGVEGNWWQSGFFFAATLQILRIELRLLGLVAGALFSEPSCQHVSFFTLFMLC